jgi:signal transduction histidine kinase
MPISLQGICARVPLGRCLCGKAAASREIQFTDSLDDRHDSHYDGLTPHGLYAVPISSNGTLLGVLGLYLHEGHQQVKEEIVFLQTVADILAGIIERKEIEEELKKYSRELMQLAESSNLISAISPTEDIYESICNIAVRNFDIKMAWIGLVENDSYDIKPIAHSGFEDGYLSCIKITQDDSPAGLGPTVMAIKTRGPHAMNNIDTDPACSAWRDSALKRGYSSSLAIPLINSEAKVFGVLNLYSGKPGFFTKKTERLFITFVNHAVSAIENRLLAEKLEDKRLQAETATKAKSDFLANMTHEMRTPLNAIIGFSEVIHNGLSGEINAKQKEYLKYVLDASAQLLSLINNLLDLSKTEVGEMELELSEVYLREIFEVSFAMFNEKFMKRKLNFSLEIEEGIDKIIADATKIKQVLYYLLGNAVKFTPEGGMVSVHARKWSGDLGFGADLIEISVEDTGIGISEKDQKKLFQPFQQVDSGLTKKHKGTGLGLSICKRLVELHGGRIWTESETEKGSKFKFVLPVIVEKQHVKTIAT